MNFGLEKKFKCRYKKFSEFGYKDQKDQSYKHVDALYLCVELNLLHQDKQHCEKSELQSLGVNLLAGGSTM